MAEQAVHVLQCADVQHKAHLTHLYFSRIHRGEARVGSCAPPARPARPERPELVNALKLPKPKDTGVAPAVHMLHQLAHIELNAIDLAWDTVARFADLQLPRAFYSDFARVADDESRHFGWCLQRLSELGHAYGDLPAHDLLWEGCLASRTDVAARLAIVPMCQEARGLDAGPRLVERLIGMGDTRTAAIVRRIAEEERAHVAVGVAWFKQVCAALGQDGGETFRGYVAAINPDASILRGPFDDAARAAVGLPSSWYTPSEWPEADQQRLLTEKYLSGPSYVALEDSGRARLADGDLLRLRQRLGLFSEVEAAAAA